MKKNPSPMEKRYITTLLILTGIVTVINIVALGVSLASEGEIVTKFGDMLLYAIPVFLMFTSFVIPSCRDKSQRSIELPDSVTEIGESAFGDCSSLTSIELPDSVTEIGYSAFYGCNSLTSIKLPNSVTKIDKWAFEDCNSLTSIELPDSVTEIGESAFDRCYSLENIIIKDGSNVVREIVHEYGVFTAEDYFNAIGSN